MMKVPETSPSTQKAYDAIATALAPSGAVKSAMFGMPSLKIEGKAFAGVFGDSLVFKLVGTSHAAALALGGAALFDPSGMGRAMKEWVVVPKAHAKGWSALAEQAFAYVSAGAVKGGATKAAAPKKGVMAKGAAKKASAKKASAKKVATKKAPKK